MIDVKEAVEIAKQRAVEMLGPGRFRLEELEREKYEGRDVWSITLSVPSEMSAAPILAFTQPSFKRFLIDIESGALLAMKIREVGLGYR